MRSSLTRAARIRARRLRRGRPACGSAISEVFLARRIPFASAKPFGDVLEGRLKLGFVDLDLPEASPQRDTSDAFGFTGLGLLELILQSGDFFPDLR
jgi:hypothetical protein